MAEVNAPHYKLQNIVQLLNSINKKIFWSIVVLSLGKEIVRRYFDLTVVNDAINLISIVSIVCYFIIDAVVNYGIIPEVENVKTDDLLDNSLGASFCIKSSDGYFDNNDLPHGVYKLAVNLFEKCFFTYSLVKAAIVKKIVIPAVMFILLLVLAYYGFKDSALPATPVLQALLSTTLLGSLIKQSILLFRLNAINESWHTLFSSKDVGANIGKYEMLVYRYWLQYEKLLSKMNPGTSQKGYEKLRSQLNNEWAEIRRKYAIV